MKQRIRIIICALTVCTALAMSCKTVASLRGNSVPETINKAAVSESGFVLKEYGGKIAVFRKNDMQNPLEITAISVDSLREGDRKMLYAGMSAQDAQAIARLLEDLGS